MRFSKPHHPLFIVLLTQHIFKSRSLKVETACRLSVSGVMSVVRAAMHRISGNVEESRVLPESAVITPPPQQHCVGTPQSSYDSVRTISWTFAIDVDGLFAADQQFRTMISQLQTSAQDANDARHLIESQLASCVPHAAEDHQKLKTDDTGHRQTFRAVTGGVYLRTLGQSKKSAIIFDR